MQNQVDADVALDLVVLLRERGTQVGDCGNIKVLRLAIVQVLFSNTGGEGVPMRMLFKAQVDTVYSDLNNISEPLAPEYVPKSKIG